MARIETIASAVVGLSALSMAVTYAVQPARRVRVHPDRPVYVDEWRSVAAAGLQTGNPNAPVQLVVFNDFECPFCARFHQVIRASEQRYRERLATVFLHRPITAHRSAVPAARAADCAASQDRLSEMVQVLFEKQDSLGTKAWESYARDAGLPDQAAFQACMRPSAPFPRLDRDTTLARKLSVFVTPTAIVNGWRFPSPPDSLALWQAIDSLLANRSPFPRRRILGVF